MAGARFRAGWGLVAGVAALVTSVAVPAPPAAAAGVPTITAIQVADYSVNSASCHRILVTVQFNPAGEAIDDIDVQIWRGSHDVDDVDVFPDEGATSAVDHYYWCSFDGLGEFRAGPTEIDYSDPETFDDGVTTDHTVVSFTIKQHSAVTLTTAPARAGKTAFHARLRYWNDGLSERDWAAGAPLHLQREQAGVWTTKATAKTDRHGRATFVRSVAGGLWRVRFSGTARTFAANSTVVG
jgi:hypothetical protein